MQFTKSDFQLAFNTHDELLKNLDSTIRDMLTVSDKDAEMRVIDVELPTNERNDDFEAQKNAKIQGISYTKPVYATIELVRGGKVVDRKKLKVLDLPQVTARGTYIVGGNEYSFPMQKRLIPGVYSRERDDGNISSWLNSSKGRNMSLSLRPSGDFVMEVEGSLINLLAVLRGLGVPDSKIEEAWGSDVFKKNTQVRGANAPSPAIKKLYQKLHYQGDPGVSSDSDSAYREWILNYFKNNSEYDPSNNEITLGKAHAHTSPEMILDATRKILGISRGEAEDDNKESLIHNHIYDLSDFAIERINQRTYKSKISRTLKRGLKDSSKSKIGEIFQRDLLQSPVESTFTQTNLSKMPKQNNPMDIAASFSEITVMGEGGIQSSHAVTRDVRAIDPSHLSFIDPAHTPEGSNIGTTVHIASGVVKKGKDLYRIMLNVKSGKMEEVNPRKAFVSRVTFPEFIKGGKLAPSEDGLVKVMYKGDIQKVKPSEVDFAINKTTDLVGVNTIGIPFLNHNNGTRVMTAAKMQSQAKPLKYREAPLVQSAVSEDTDTTIEQAMGYSALPKSPVDGVVSNISKGTATIKDRSGKTHDVGYQNDVWLNEGNFDSVQLKVKVGDTVKAGQILGDSNYTKDGTLALGMNLNVAYVAYKGYNHEDGVVVSESCASKLTSLHAHQKVISIQDNEIADKKKFLAYFPAAFNAEQIASVGDNGLVKEGTVLKKGDPLIIKMKSIEEDTLSKKLQNISRLLVQDYRDSSEVWPKDTLGTVAEVHVRKKDILIVVKTEEKLKIGDKIVGRYGNKGTITTILTNEEMPKDKDGNPLDILLDPSGVPGRMNIGQILETTASKIAVKDGKPFISKPFGGDHTNQIGKELAKRKLSDHDTIYDADGPIKGVLVGQQYILKLEHQVEKKLSARGAGPKYSYSMEGQPTRGDGKSGQAVGLNELYALLSHGADANLKEIYTFKGDMNFEAWRAVENGTMLPPPTVPASSEKFIGMLRGMGVNLVDDGTKVKMVPFLDSDIKAISNGEIKDATALRAKDLKEEKGGLFDFRTTGGLVGEKWAHISLAEPMPHPTFEKSILAVTGLKADDLKAIVGHKKGIVNGQVVEADAKGAVTGGQAIKNLLASIDIDKRLKEINENASSLKGSELNKVHKEARVLKNFRDTKVKLEDMVVSTIPVVPPKYRPIVEMPNGDISVSDINEHYRAIIMVNNQLKQINNRPGLIEEANKLKADLYNGLSGAMGFGMGLVEKPDIKGFATTIAGNNPKYGYYHSRLIKKRQDVSGRAVVGPEPNLDMDQIGIPENMAWKIFEPFVIKDLKQSGLTSMSARQEVENRTRFAKDALLRSMESRPVFANRAPTLHKYSFMAFKPILVPGSAVKLPVEVLGGFNADFDGDTFAVHVPVTEEAVREAYSMMPSNNLYSAGKQRKSLSVELGKEYMMGIYKLTRNGRTTSSIFATAEQAIQAAEQKKIRWDDIISVNRIGRTTAGKILINKDIPEDSRDYQAVFDAGLQGKFLVDLEKKHGKEVLKNVVNSWKLAGRIHVYESGTSFLLSDLKMLTKERKALYAEADRKAQVVRSNSRLSKEEKDKKLIEIYSEVDKKIMSLAGSLPANSAGNSNNISDMVQAGMSKPGPSQLKQLVGTLGLMLDHRQQIMPEPVRGNYAEGLESSEFFAHMYAQRKGMIDKSQSVSGPGMLSKEITNSATTQKITMLDCGTKNGKYHPVDAHLIDRVLAEPVGTAMAGSIITSDTMDTIKKSGKDKVKVRTILTCEAHPGICAKCFGVDEHGSLPAIGRNVGVSEIQALTERSVQLPMKSFHSGGVATADKGVSNAFDRTMQILRMPENIKGKATLAEVGGIVEDIRKSGYGGNIIMVAGKEHKAPKGLDVIVKRGDSVKKGDALTSGIVKPQELLKLKGLDAMQDQLTDDLHKTFANAGVKLHKRTYEVTVKAITEQVRVLDPGDCDEFVPGDYTMLAKVKAWNSANTTRRQIKYVTILPGSEYAPTRTDDWARRMALNRIQKTIEDGVGMGFASDRNSTSPFVNLVLGPGTRVPKPGDRK